MTKNSERKQELVEYIELLGKLQGSGLKYNLEINKAVKELNSLIMDKSEGVIDKFHKNVSDNRLKQGKLVLVNDEHRGIGKTTILIRYSGNYSGDRAIPIIVGCESSKKYVLNLATEQKFENSVKVYTMDETRHTYFPNGVLIDDSVSLNQLSRYLIDSHCIIRGGFAYNDLFI